MENVVDSNHFVQFEFEGQKQKVSFIETTDVTEGVQCDVYKFDGDNTKDLGIIRVKPGYKTPRQRVLKGDRTIEGYVSGNGKLIVSTAVQEKVYKSKEGEELKVDVKVGEIMQWQAGDRQLVAYEICFPPYEDGRYEDLP